jgi:hypothetical protein
VSRPAQGVGNVTAKSAIAGGCRRLRPAIEYTLVRAKGSLVLLHPRSALPVLGLAVAMALACLLPPAAWSSGVTTALLPASGYVSPGSEFTLELWLTAPGDSINAYAAVVEYDPAALTFLQASPLSLQEGSYMTSACGNTVNYFTSAGDSLVITHVLMCNGIALRGPGTSTGTPIATAASEAWAGSTKRPAL